MELLKALSQNYLFVTVSGLLIAASAWYSYHVRFKNEIVASPRGRLPRIMLTIIGLIISTIGIVAGLGLFTSGDASKPSTPPPQPKFWEVEPDLRIMAKERFQIEPRDCALQRKPAGGDGFISCMLIVTSFGADSLFGIRGETCIFDGEGTRYPISSARIAGSDYPFSDESRVVERSLKDGIQTRVYLTFGRIDQDLKIVQQLMLFLYEDNADPENVFNITIHNKGALPVAGANLRSRIPKLPRWLTQLKFSMHAKIAARGNGLRRQDPRCRA